MAPVASGAGPGAMDRTVNTAALAFALVGIFPTLPAQSAAAAPAKSAADEPVRGLPTKAKAWTGDFDVMLERRTIRVLAPYSRSLYFSDQGHELGLSAESVRGFERWLNEKYAKQLGNRPLTVLIVPTTRDRLLSDVAGGLGDLAVGNLTVTEERLQLVDFVTDPHLPAVNEIVVTGPASPAIVTADNLAGKTVHVRRASSYFESLTALNARLAAAGSPLVTIVPVPEALEDEDMLEMVDIGMLQAVIVDDWKARMWAQILPRLKLNDQAVVRSGGRIGWALRKNSPRLGAEVLHYMKAQVTKGLIASRMDWYMRYAKRLRNPTESAPRTRFEKLLALFEKFGQRYHFDHLMLAAQGYQESRLNQDARSPVGAIGIMQIMPETGEKLKVGDIHLTEPNIHAGAKYMDQLMTNYFADAQFDEMNRTLFAFASYNAGPGNIARMRDLAAKRGLDPNQWFNCVEVVTAQRIGLETTTYVRNIYKYYVAYKLMEEARAAEQSAREQLKPPPAPKGDLHN
jgi:membrane-bound lytic murein transglycosylase MltF